MNVISKKAYCLHGFFTPVSFLENGRIHVSALRFPSLEEALAWEPKADARHSADQKTFNKYYGHRQLIG
jgi:hypothetical protein